MRFATFRSREDAGAFGRRFDRQVIKNAATIAMLYFMLFFFGGITISVYEGLPVLTCFYEAASAVGTVGLTLGVTPGLHINITFDIDRTYVFRSSRRNDINIRGIFRKEQ